MNNKRITNDDSRQGQSVIEYLLLVGVIIALLVAFLRPGGYFATTYEDAMERQGDDVVNVTKVMFPTR